MSAELDSLTLRVGDSEYRDCESVAAKRSLEDAASSFSLAVSGEELIDPGAPCEVLIGEDTVITGYVDSSGVDQSGDSSSVSVAGRSKTADLVDCSCIVAPAQFKRQTIAQIASALAAPYGVEVVCTVDGLEPLARWSYEIGETVHDAIERLAREAALLVCDDPQGRLVLTRVADPLVVHTELRQPGNILRASLQVDISKRYSEVRVKAQRTGDDENFGKVVAGVEALAEDDLVRHRVLVLRGEKSMTPAQAYQRAVWEAATRWGQSVQLEVTVQGWRDDSGLLWQPNAVAHVVHRRFQIDADLLVAGVRFSADSGGRLATLTLGPPAGYEPEPPKERRRRSGPSGIGLLDREVTL